MSENKDYQFFTKSLETVQTEEYGQKTKVSYCGKTPWIINNEDEVPDFLRELTKILAKADPWDEVCIQICGTGGSIHLGEAIKEAVKKTKARVLFTSYIRAGSLHASLLSWAFLEGFRVEISEGTIICFHDVCQSFSGEMALTINEIKAYRESISKAHYKLWSAVLTEEELSDLKDKGVNIFLTAEEFVNRLSVYEGDITLVPFCKPAKKKA